MPYGNLLITGGTGSFGHAFTGRVLADDLAERVTILSRDEVKQAQMKVQFNDSRLRFFLGDVRDRARLVRAFQGVDVVAHAAALKRVDRSGEAFDEFLKTNVVGAMNVIEACHVAGVEKCMALSTDKAVSSTTPYGASKAVAEWLFIGGNAWGQCRFSLVRYGNVLGSRGSVLETWAEQYAAGKPLAITDPTMTRFWLGIEDAVDLALLALGRMRGGEVFIPKRLGEGGCITSSKIVDLARSRWPGAEFEVTGKRSYEKWHEVLVADEERDRLRDLGDVYVLLPMHVRWEPLPYGFAGKPVGAEFRYRSDD